MSQYTPRKRSPLSKSPGQCPLKGTGDNVIDISPVPRLNLSNAVTGDEVVTDRGNADSPVKALTPGIEELVKNLNVRVDEITDVILPRSPNSLTNMVIDLRQRVEKMTDAANPTSVASGVNRLSSRGDFSASQLEDIRRDIRIIRDNQTDVFNKQKGVEDMLCQTANVLISVQKGLEALQTQSKLQWEIAVKLVGTHQKKKKHRPRSSS